MLLPVCAVSDLVCNNLVFACTSMFTIALCLSLCSKTLQNYPIHTGRYNIYCIYICVCVRDYMYSLRKFTWKSSDKIPICELLLTHTIKELRVESLRPRVAERKGS